MKESSLAVSLGLAAIDGLTCAFIAILILALILIGPGLSPGASDTDNSQTLMIHIAGDNQAQGGLDLRLLVDVTVDGHVLKSPAATVESASRMVKLDTLQDFVKPGGGVWWKDCQTKIVNECLAEMFVTKVKPDGPIWRVRLRVADAGESFTDGVVTYKVWLQNDSGKRVEDLVLSVDHPVVVCVDWAAKTVQAPCP